MTPAGSEGASSLPADLPLVLAHHHHAMAVGERLSMDVARAEGLRERPGAPDLADLVVGAGFAPDPPVPAPGRRAGLRHVEGVRERTLPDTVGPDMRLLVCGLNPSVHAADAGVGFARPGNRFWPAALDAGVVRVDRDPFDALTSCGIGMTDLVKRATPRADELTGAEYADGLARIERLVAWLQPGAVCFVGLAGWRAARRRRAVAGVQPDEVGGRPVYVMPSTSGLNAHSSRQDLTEHLERAAALADDGTT